jgi:hypothetical protein
MEGEVRPSQLNRPPNLLDANLVLARLAGNDPEQMPSVGLIRLDGKDLPIDLFGSLEPPRLMVLHGNR